MVTVNLGSIGVEVHALVPNVPSSLSGARLLAIAHRKREFVQNWTGETIGSQSIEEKHQDIIINLTASETASSMMLTGVDASSIKLGDFSIKKGAGGNLDLASKRFEERAMKQLNSLGRKINFYKALG